MSQTPSPAEPEAFPPALLTSPLSARQAHFEQQCLIEHPRLLDTLDAIVQVICPVGENEDSRREAAMVLLEKSIVWSIPLETSNQRPDLTSERLFASK